jgi:hypothetical protein
VVLLTLALAGVQPRLVRAQQPATLDVAADRTRVTVGDRIGVNLVLRLPASAQPDFSGVERQFGDLDPLAIGLPEEQPAADGMKEVRVRYEVAAFRPGPVQLPALTVPFSGPDGEGAATSAPIAITVDSVIPPGTDPTDVRGLKPQIDLPYRAGMSTRQKLLLVGSIAVAVGVLGAGAWLWWQRRRPRPVPVAAVAVASPAEAAARAELDRIAALNLLDSGDLKTFHALIATCIRRYLSDRYGFAAFAMTTSELARRMEREGVDRWPARLVAGLLGECDAVNYAQYLPARIRAENNLSIAYEIVDITHEGAHPMTAVR